MQKKIVRVWEVPRLKTAVDVEGRMSVGEFLQAVAKKLNLEEGQLSLHVVPAIPAQTADELGACLCVGVGVGVGVGERGEVRFDFDSMIYFLSPIHSPSLQVTPFPASSIAMS